MDHKVLTGLSYSGKYAEAGSVVSDIPSKSVPWLMEQGLIEAADKPSKVKSEPVSVKGDK